MASTFRPPSLTLSTHSLRPLSTRLSVVYSVYYTILYYTILYYTVLYCTVLYYAILYYTVLYYTILYCTVLYCTILYYTILYYIILYYTILYYTILYYTILYYDILYFTTLYYIILHDSLPRPVARLRIPALRTPRSSPPLLRRPSGVSKKVHLRVRLPKKIPAVDGCREEEGDNACMECTAWLKLAKLL